MMQGGRAFRAKVLDFRHPFFRPLWRKIALVAVLAIWTLIEVFAGHPVWGLLVGGICAYAVYGFFLAPPLTDTDQTGPEA